MNTPARSRQRDRSCHDRRGTVLVKLAFLLPVLIGFMGLTIDGGLMLSSRRQSQNAADAAALAAAWDLMNGRSAKDALDAANYYIQQANGLSQASQLVAGTTFNNPPQSGPFTGKDQYVAVIVETPYPTFFMHLLTGETDPTVAARAVAGFEKTSSGAGVMALDPDPADGTGIDIVGSVNMRVNGRVVVNSQHGGEDENGDPVAGPRPYPALSFVGTGGIYAKRLDVGGGVASFDPFGRDRIHPYEAGDPYPLHCRQPRAPDPLAEVPVPAVGQGVDDTLRGAVNVIGTIGGGFVDGQGYINGVNSQADGGESIANGLHIAQRNEVILHPGVYDSIEVVGGNVYMIPGIYVIRGGGMSVVGGTVLAENVMIYNTGDNYNPQDGSPDIYDGTDRPPQGGATDGATFGAFNIVGSANIQITPIDVERIQSLAGGYQQLYHGAPSVSPAYHGMVFFQRRYNTGEVQFVGTSDDVVSGTFYGPWANFELVGDYSLPIQFITGTISLVGNFNLQSGSGAATSQQQSVFLAE